MNTLLLLGGIMMFLAVALGAFGAHALKEKLSDDKMKVYQTGIQYHLIHGIGLLLLGVLAGQMNGSSQVILAGWFLFAGIILFSGSLYALSLSGIRKLGAITPLGGLAWLAGWAILIAAVVQNS